MLVGLESVVREPTEVIYMPDPYDLLGTVKDEVGSLFTHLSLRQAPITVLGEASDTLRFTAWAVEEGVEALLVLGGDGTNRLVAKESQAVPLFPVSGGTNNVFADSVEPTIAGMALGFFLNGEVPQEEVVEQSKILRCVQGQREVDIALVDVVLVTTKTLGTKAVWEPETVRAVVVTQGSPWAIGLSALVGRIAHITPSNPFGAYVELGEPGVKVKVPLAPGLVTVMPVKKFTLLSVGQEAVLDGQEGILALDGEREVSVRQGEAWRIRLENTGPLRVDIRKVMSLAQERGVYDG